MTRPIPNRFRSAVQSGLLAAVLLPSAVFAQTWFPIQGDARQVVPFAAPLRAFAFPFDRVRLLDGPVHPYLASDSAWLRSLDADRMMAPYVLRAGLPKVADPYPALGASTTGHFLSAVALAAAGTGDAALRIKARRMVAEFARVQARIGTGDIGVGDAPNLFWDTVARGGSNLRQTDFSLNGVNVPWYIYHKALAGLLDAYLWAGVDSGLVVARGVGDWAVAKFAGLSDADFQRMLQCEFGGMEESLENLYLLTGDTRYHALSRRFVHHRILDSLYQGLDDLTHKHGNTTLPKITSAARYFETLDDAAEERAATTAWNSIYDGRTYSMGGTTSWESWQVAPGGFPLIDWGGNTRRGPETCVSYNLLKTGMHLLAARPVSGIADDMEHTLWNHVLAAWNPDNHGTLYYTPVWPGENKGFDAAEDWWPCCRNTGLESQTRHAAFAWMHDAQGLLVEQFLSSRLDWTEKGVVATLSTAFPDEDTVRISFAIASGSASFALKVRRPAWADSAVLLVNGTVAARVPDSTGHLVVQRTWKDGDQARLVARRTLRVVPKPDDPKTVSVFLGPILLAAIVPGSDTAPAFAGLRSSPGSWIHPVEGSSDWWSRAADGRTIVWRPFFRIREERYALYSRNWDASVSNSVYEAEQAAVVGSKLYSNPAASAGGYVGGIDGADSRVVFRVHRERAGACTLWVRYANGAGAATHAVRAGTWSDSVHYRSTGGWEDAGRFDSAALLATLPSGDFSLTFAKGSNWAELDRIRIAEPAWPACLPLTWEAEDAAVTHARVDTGLATASGRADVGGMDAADSKVEFAGIVLPAALRCTFRLLYSNGTGASASDPVVCAGRSAIVSLPPTGGWSLFDSTEFQLDLPTGTSSLSITRGTGYAELDALRLVAALPIPTTSASPRLAPLRVHGLRDGIRIEGGADLAGASLEIRDLQGRRVGSAIFVRSDEGARAEWKADGSATGARVWGISGHRSAFSGGLWVAR
jgi:DUF1680 family protein